MWLEDFFVWGTVVLVQLLSSWCFVWRVRGGGLGISYYWFEILLAPLPPPPPPTPPARLLPPFFSLV